MINDAFDKEKILRYIMGFTNLVMINLLFTLTNLPILIWLGLIKNNLISVSIIIPFLLSLTIPMSLIAIFSCVMDTLTKNDVYSFKNYFKKLKIGFQKDSLVIYLLWYVLLMTILLILIPSIPWLGLLIGFYFVITCMLVIMIAFAIVETLTFNNTFFQTIRNSFLSIFLNWQISVCLAVYLLFVQLLSGRIPAAPFFLFISLYAFLFIFMYRPKLKQRIITAREKMRNTDEWE